MAKYKRTTVVEAKQWFKHGDHPDVINDNHPWVSGPKGFLRGKLIHGIGTVWPGNWVVKERDSVTGEYYYCIMSDEYFKNNFTKCK